MPRPRVAVICGTYEPRACGVSDYVRRLLESLQDRVEPTIISSPDWEIDDVAAALHAARIASAEIVHVQYAPVSFRWRKALVDLPRLARQILGPVPVVVTAHEFEPDLLRLFTSADATITTNVEHAERIRQAAARADHGLTCIPIGPNIRPVDGNPAVRAAEARAYWSIPLDAPLVVFFGFLHPVKGLEYLLRALVAIRAHLPNAHLVLAGAWRSLALPDTQGDAYRDRLLGLLDDLDLRAAVRLTDYLAECDVSALLFAADAVALPFTYGVSFKSGSLLAALVHMRAVVATTPKVEDPRLECGRHLLCVAPRDEHSLADALLRVLREPALRCELGAAGAEAARPFDWRTIADEHLTLYDRLLDRR